MGGVIKKYIFPSPRALIIPACIVIERLAIRKATLPRNKIKNSVTDYGQTRKVARPAKHL